MHCQFALAGIVPRFIYLKYGLSLVLLVIGFKLIANHLYGGKFVPTKIALLVTAVLIGGSIVLSAAHAHSLAGRDRGTAHRLGAGQLSGSALRQAH